jgi:hypothetical protein
MVYLKPDTVLLYDRVKPKSSSTAFDWRLHFPAQPTVSGTTLQSTNERGGVTVVLLLGDPPQILPDTDLKPDGSRAWRAQSASRTGRFLAAIKVGSGRPPPLAATLATTSGDMEGVAVGNDVVLFSKHAFGRQPELGFSYTLPRNPRRTHTLVNMSGSVAVKIAQEGANTVVTVAKGTDQRASAEGVIRFSEQARR